MAEINDIADEIKKRMGLDKPKPVGTPYIPEFKPVEISQVPMPDFPPNTLQSEASVVMTSTPPKKEQKGKVENIQFNSVPNEPIQQFLPEEAVEMTSEHQLLMISILISYVAVHGTDAEKEDLLKCISFIYKFDGYETYMKKVMAIMLKYKDESASFFDIFAELPVLDQKLVNAEVQKRADLKQGESK